MCDLLVLWLLEWYSEGVWQAAAEWALSLSLLFVPADLRRRVCGAVSRPRRSLSCYKTHSASHSTPVVSHYDRDAICHSMTNSLGGSSKSWVNQTKANDFVFEQVCVFVRVCGIFPGRKDSSHGEFCFGICHSISHLGVWSHNESTDQCSASTELGRCAEYEMNLLDKLSGSLACAHSGEGGGMSVGVTIDGYLCSQVELWRRAAVEQVQLHQHASVRGWTAGRAWGGDAHYDVSDEVGSTRKSNNRGKNSK